MNEAVLVRGLQQIILSLSFHTEVSVKQLLVQLHVRELGT